MTNIHETLREVNEVYVGLGRLLSDLQKQVDRPTVSQQIEEQDIIPHYDNDDKAQKIWAEIQRSVIMPNGLKLALDYVETIDSFSLTISQEGNGHIYAFIDLTYPKFSDPLGFRLAILSQFKRGLVQQFLDYDRLTNSIGSFTFTTAITGNYNQVIDANKGLELPKVLVSLGDKIKLHQDVLQDYTKVFDNTAKETFYELAMFQYPELRLWAMYFFVNEAYKAVCSDRYNTFFAYSKATNGHIRKPTISLNGSYDDKKPRFEITFPHVENKVSLTMHTLSGPETQAGFTDLFFDCLGDSLHRSVIDEGENY